MLKLALAFALVLALALPLAACKEEEEGTIKIGTKNFTENLILGEIYALALEDKGNLAVDRTGFNLASSAVHQAIVSGEIDLYPEYTGTGLIDVLKLKPLTDPQAVYEKVAAEYKEKFDLVWLEYAPANDSQGIAVTKAVSDQYGIKTISDLQKNAGNIRFISQGEFDERTDGIPGLTKLYGAFKWKSSKVVDNSLKYTTLYNGEGDATPAYTTEGKLADPFFVVLEDDKHLWPPYNIAPVVRQVTIDAHSGIADILDAVNETITTEVITELNAKVDVNGEEYADVAKDYYNSIKDSIDA